MRKEPVPGWQASSRKWVPHKQLGRATSIPDGSPSHLHGMAARANILGATGANHPDHWIGGMANPRLHAIAVLFARNVEERERCTREHQEYLSRCTGVEALSSLDLEALPPFGYPHEHFGYHDRLSQPVIEGTLVEPTPGSGPAIEAGEFFLGYPDEEGGPAALPDPASLSRFSAATRRDP